MPVKLPGISNSALPACLLPGSISNIPFSGMKPPMGPKWSFLPSVSIYIVESGKWRNVSRGGHSDSNGGSYYPRGRRGRY